MLTPSMTMALVDAFGSEAEPLSQELTVRPSDSSSGSFSYHLQRRIASVSVGEL